MFHKIKMGGFVAYFPYLENDIVRIEEQTDYALSILMANDSVRGHAVPPEERLAAAREWLRRYPDGPKSRTGTKSWAVAIDALARDMVRHS